MRRPTATPATHKKRDPGLEETIGDIRARAGRRRQGRILIVLELLEGRVIRRHVEESAMTEDDYDQLMRERPGRHRPNSVMNGPGSV